MTKSSLYFKWAQIKIIGFFNKRAENKIYSEIKWKQNEGAIISEAGFCLRYFLTYIHL